MAHHGSVTWAAVILTGGTAMRLGGRDKASLEVAGRSLLEHALAAVAGAGEVVVVGPQVPAIDVPFVREDPPGGGPLAGVAAGVAHLAPGHDRVVVLAVDMPGVTPGTVARLLAASADGDAAWLVDEDGRRQLAGAVRPSLVPAPEVAHGAAMRVPAPGATYPRSTARPPTSTPGRTWLGCEAGTRRGRHPTIGLEGRAQWRKIGAVNLHDWIDELCDALDIETEVDEALVLDLAKVAADNVIRKAAPITTYLLGYAAGSSDADVEEIERLAAKAQALAENWDHPSGVPLVVVPDDVPDDSTVDHTGDEFEA
jgi:molybdopterin-guanine dinucleotide biosynthesis protein A